MIASLTRNGLGRKNQSMTLIMKPLFIGSLRSITSPPPVPPRATKPGLIGGRLPPSQAPPPPQQQQQQSSNEKVIFDVTASDFKQTVLDSKVPVILDCWADWCGPCKQLGPILEREVKAQRGKVRLAKLNTDQHPQLAAQLQIKNLPTLFLVHQGKLVDQVVGFNGEAKVKELVTKAAGLSSGGGEQNDLMQMESVLANIMEMLKISTIPNEKSPTKEEMTDIVRMLQHVITYQLPPLPKGTVKTPKRRSEEASIEGYHVIAYAGLIRCALLDGNTKAAEEIASKMKTTFSKLALEHVEAKSALSLVKLSSSSSNTDEERTRLETALKQNPGDSASRLALAKSLFSNGSHGEAIEHALELLKRDRQFQDAAAKTLLLDIFNVLGGSSDMVKDARRRMSSILMN